MVFFEVVVCDRWPPPENKKPPVSVEVQLVRLRQTHFCRCCCLLLLLLLVVLFIVGIDWRVISTCGVGVLLINRPNIFCAHWADIALSMICSGLAINKIYKTKRRKILLLLFLLSDISYYQQKLILLTFSTQHSSFFIMRLVTVCTVYGTWYGTE